VKTRIVMLCLMLGVALAAGPANTPVTAPVVNDVNPAAQGRAPYGPFSTMDDPPTKEWGLPVTMTYTVGVTPVQDTLMWLSAGQTELRIYVYNIKDPARPLIDSFPETGGPSGWGIRDMAWKASTNEVFAGYDNQAFHVYDATTHVPNNTYTVSGYSGTVRGFGYSPVQDSCWTCNFAVSPMTKFSITGANGHQVKAAADMASAYGIAVDTLQQCFWVTQAGAAGTSPTWKMDFSYNVVDSFNATGWDLGGGCEMWLDTFLLQLEQGTPDEVFCMRFNLGPPPSHDVGVNAIVAPAGNIAPGPVTPEATVRNFGANPESGIPVTCWIDSGATRVYSANATLPGPLGAGTEANVTFTPDWNPGPAGAQYSVTMFTALPGDVNTGNDTTTGTTTVTGAVFSDTIRVNRIAYYGPTIDGNIAPGEWSGAIPYDISDILGRGGVPWPAGSNIAYYLYDFAEGYIYFAMDCPNYTGRIDYDQFGPYMDEDKSGTWSTDSSEGNYWVQFVATDDVIYRALLSTLPDIWLMGSTPGALSVSSLTSGHLQFETKIPIGPDRWEYSINTGDTVGYFQYTAVVGGSNYIGWWPQTLTSSQWSYPQYYGPMIFDSVMQGVEGQDPKTPYALYKASPSLVRDYANIGYYVGRQANVELGVYDATGSLVKSLASGVVTPGERTARWNRTDNRGKRVADGAYFYRLVVDGEAVSGKAIVLK
jgi:hypothetical protein